MKSKIHTAFLAACVLSCFQAVSVYAELPTLPTKPELPTKTDAPSPISAVTPGTNPSPELVGQITKELGVTQNQAVGGSGALFGLAKSRLNPEDFGKVAGAVPGMDGLLAAAPQSPLGGDSTLGAIGSALPGKAGTLASVAGSFKSLGLTPDMAAKFVPILTNFVGAKGGSGTASLLAGAFK